MDARFPVLSDALYGNERIDAKIKAHDTAVDYVSARRIMGEPYPEAERRVMADDSTPPEILKALRESRRVR